MPQKSLDIIMSSASPSFESISVPATNSATTGSWLKGPSNILSLFGWNRCKTSCVRPMPAQTAHHHVQDTSLPHHHTLAPLEHTAVFPPELNNVNNTGMTAFFSGAQSQPVYPGYTKSVQNTTAYQHSSSQSTTRVELSNNRRNSAQFSDVITPGGSNMADGTHPGLLGQYAIHLKNALLSSCPTSTSTTWVNPAWLSSFPMTKVEQNKQRLVEQTAWPVDGYNHQVEELLAPPQHVTSKGSLGGSDASGGSKVWHNTKVLEARQENLLPFHVSQEQTDLFLWQQQQEYQLYQRQHQQRQQQQQSGYNQSQQQQQSGYNQTQQQQESGYNQSQRQQESYQCYQVPHHQSQSTLPPTDKMKDKQLPWGELAVLVPPPGVGVDSNTGRPSAVEDTAFVCDSAGMLLFASSSDAGFIVGEACSYYDGGEGYYEASDWSGEPWTMETETCNSFEGEEIAADAATLEDDDTGGNSCLPASESTLDPNAKEWTGTDVISRCSSTGSSSGSVGSSKLNPEAKEWVPKNVIVPQQTVGAENYVKDDFIFVLKREEEFKSGEANKNRETLPSLNFDGWTCTNDCSLVVDLRDCCGAATAGDVDCVDSAAIDIEENKSTQAKPTSVSEINDLCCNRSESPISEIILCNSSNSAAIVPCSSLKADDDSLGGRDEVDRGVVHENLTTRDILPCKDVHVENTSDSGHVNNNTNRNRNINSIGALRLQLSLSCSSLADDTLPDNDEDDDDGVVFVEHDEVDVPCVWLVATDDDSCVSDASSDSDSEEEEEEDSSEDENDFITFTVTAVGRDDSSSDDDSDEDDVIFSSCRESCDGGNKTPASPAKSWFICNEVINPKESALTPGESDSEEEEQEFDDDDDDWNSDDESCDSGTGRISAEDWAFGESLVSCKTSIAKQLQLLARVERERNDCVTKVEKANQRWSSQAEGDGLVNGCTRQCDKTVRFSDDVDVTYIEPLMTYILNGIRFRRHVQSLSEVLTPVLLSEHRNRVYTERFDEGQCTEKGDEGGALKKPVISSNSKSEDVSVVGACKNVRINGYR